MKVIEGRRAGTRLLSLLCFGVSTALLIAGCGGSGTGLINVPNPRVRFTNGFEGLGTVNVRVGVDIVGVSIPFGTSSDTAIVRNGRRDVTVGTTTFEGVASVQQFLFETDKRYTAVGYGASGNRSILIVADDKTKSTNDTIALRAIHAAPKIGPVDIYVTTVASGDALPTNPTVPGVAVGTATDYLIVPTNGQSTLQLRIRIYKAGQTSGPLTDTQITPNTTERYTAIAYDKGGAIGLLAQRDDL